MRRKRTIVLACHDAGGTVPPVLALASALGEAGHAVTVLSQPSVRERAEAVGARFIALSEIGDYATDAALEDQLDLTVPAIAGPSVGEDLARVVDEVRADVIVVDANLSGCLAAAEALPQPSAVLLHSMYKTFVDTWFADLWPFLGPMINQTRARLGVPPAESWAATFDPHDLILSIVPPSLDAPVSTVPTQLVHLGFLVPPPPPEPAAATFPAGDGPAVLVGLSTTYQAQEQLLQTIVDGIAGAGARGLVTTAGRVDIQELRIPRGVRVIDRVPHQHVLPDADAMVTHAGLGTIAAALSFGVPLVCTPIARDQPLNTSRVEHVGAGIGCPAPTPDDIASALAQVLDQPSYRDRAAAMATESQALGGAKAFVELLDAL
jgi:UDP:flavonoid glycosyltransferase YjiC (YdhE family)